MSALDALPLRNVEATTTHLFATSHNAGRSLTRRSQARSKRAGEQAETVVRLPDRTERWATMVAGLACTISVGRRTLGRSWRVRRGRP
jgi:hypothetical protein